jgi:hypothetical protein
MSWRLNENYNLLITIISKVLKFVDRGPVL